MSSSHPASQEIASPTFYISAIEIKLAVESLRTIRSIKLYKNDQIPRDIAKTIRAGQYHREEFVPPLSVSLHDHISVLVLYYRRFLGSRVFIDISLRDNEGICEENGIKSYRKKRHDVEIVVISHHKLPPLVATVTQDIPDRSRFRFLVIGNSGVGKSSLISKVFGVQSAEPSRHVRGESDIERELTSPTNKHIVVHDSLGFEAGDERHMELLIEFISTRKKMHKIEDRLHAIWLCLETPYAGGRLFESGVEVLLERRKEILGEIPLVVVLTKVDLLDGFLEIDQPENEDMESYRSRCMDEVIKPLHNITGTDVTHVTVSVEDDYYTSLLNLLKATDENMIKYQADEVPRVLVSIAQRISITDKIKLTMTIGKKSTSKIKDAAQLSKRIVGYWSMLLNNAAFLGRTLNECLEVIREDITDVWNFNDPDRCLMDSQITAALLSPDNIRDAASDNATSNGTSFADAVASALARHKGIAGSLESPASHAASVVGVTVTATMQATYEVYQEGKMNAKILMAYIIDLTCIMQIVFLLASGDRVTRKMTTLAVAAYDGSRRRVHQLVEQFDGQLGVLPGGRDFVLEKIEEYIWHFSIADHEIRGFKDKLSDFGLDLRVLRDS